MPRTIYAAEVETCRPGHATILNERVFVAKVTVVSKTPDLTFIHLAEPYRAEPFAVIPLEHTNDVIVTENNWPDILKRAVESNEELPVSPDNHWVFTESRAASVHRYARAFGRSGYSLSHLHGSYSILIDDDVVIPTPLSAYRYLPDVTGTLGSDDEVRVSVGFSDQGIRIILHPGQDNDREIDYVYTLPFLQRMDALTALRVFVSSGYQPPLTPELFDQSPSNNPAWRVFGDYYYLESSKDEALIFLQKDGAYRALAEVFRRINGLPQTSFAKVQQEFVSKLELATNADNPGLEIQILCVDYLTNVL